jgi:hypothetical protein
VVSCPRNTCTYFGDRTAGSLSEATAFPGRAPNSELLREQKLSGLNTNAADGRFRLAPVGLAATGELVRRIAPLKFESARQVLRKD